MTACNQCPTLNLAREHLVYNSAGTALFSGTYTPSLVALRQLSPRKQRRLFRRTMLDAFKKAMTMGTPTVSNSLVTSTGGMVKLNACHAQYATTAAGAYKAVLDLYSHPWRKYISAASAVANQNPLVTVGQVGQVIDVLDLVRTWMAAKVHSNYSTIYVKDWWGQTYSSTTTLYAWLYNNTDYSLLGQSGSHLTTTGYTGGLLDAIAYYTYCTN